MTRTNAYTLLCMIIRAMAVLSMIGLLSAAPSILGGAPNRSMLDEALWRLVLWIVGASVVLLLLWLYADKLARLALVRPQDQVFESSLEPTQWLGVAISGIGAWQLFDGITDAVSLIPRMMALRQVAAMGMPDLTPQVEADAIGMAVQLALAVIFLLRGHVLAQWLDRWRFGSAADRGRSVQDGN